MAMSPEQLAERFRSIRDDERAFMVREDEPLFRVLIMPGSRLAATGLNIKEAGQWITTYNAIMRLQPLRAVIDSELERNEVA